MKGKVYFMSFNDFISSGFTVKYINDNSTTITTSTVITLLSVAFVLCAVIAYILGSLNFAIIISGKTYKQDIREHGSKNAGMTNMMRTYGKKAAALTLLGDAFKAIIAGLLGYAILGQLGAYIAGTFCVLGHMFPVFYKFKGGKGVVTTAASILICNPFVFVIMLTIFIIIVAGTRYISLGSVMCMLIYPFVLNGIDVWLNGSCPYVIFALLTAVLVIFKHKDNIKRLRQGKENKFSFKKSVKSEDIQK